MKKLKQTVLLSITFLLISVVQVKAINYGCGDTLRREDRTSDDYCICEGGSFQNYSLHKSQYVEVPMVCCGVLEQSGMIGQKCSVPSAVSASPTPEDEGDDLVNDFPVPDSETLNKLNPLKIAGGDESLADPGTLISKAVNSFVFPIAGIILFLMLVFGGFQMLMGAANSKSLEEGKQRVTSAIIGFIILFASYWIIQLIEIIFHLNILG